MQSTATARVTDSCTSCGKRLIERGTTSFLCPSCGNGKIGRCVQCRDQGVTWACGECGFAGP
ncbi:MAG TPA: zinc finger domain-containing protein [Candidatus Thermoplasmatota archaeon]|nr:zinc finger domain-containing protein [Candidatus Thermoplasmatota archaeon]